MNPWAVAFLVLDGWCAVALIAALIIGPWIAGKHL